MVHTCNCIFTKQFSILYVKHVIYISLGVIVMPLPKNIRCALRPEKAMKYSRQMKMHEEVQLKNKEETVTISSNVCYYSVVKLEIVCFCLLH